ncbi:hypothetical protein LP418_00430 [Nocardioides sp. B-3]|nr:hypothetical protein [Nocardioides sp. B-3]UUZ59659.1 hypothetical protein LP418_00430 [Nocardioides sp. B-3]
MTAFLHPLDVGELWGVGEKTQAMLHRLGLMTVGDVAHTPVRTLQRAVGHHLGSHLHELAWGTDRRAITPKAGPLEPERSMGADETFTRDTDDREVIVRELLRLSHRVTGRMRTAGVAGRTVTIKIRFADFTTITPLAHPARGHRRDGGDLSHRHPALRRARSAAGPAPAGGGAGGGARRAHQRATTARPGGAGTRLGRGGSGRRPGHPALGTAAVRPASLLHHT